MANWHARTGDRDGNSFEILFHVPIPSANNRVGVNYRLALVGAGLGGTSKMTPDGGSAAAGKITAAELTQIQAGELIEHSQLVATFPGETSGQLQTRIDALYTALADVNGAFITALKHQLDYWGHDRNVA